MVPKTTIWVVIFGLGATLPGTLAMAQAPTLPSELPAVSPGSNSSVFGPIPGATGVSPANQPAGTGAILGGRVGTATPRVPTSLTIPNGGIVTPPPTVLATPTLAPLSEVPLYGTLAMPGAEDEGPADGLTIDQAIDLLIRQNLDLLARRFEIPLAQADALTASLRANPLIYSDAQLVPYGEYTKKQPGGETQYDVNVSYPIDYSRKRKFRTAAANAATQVVEAQYQDAVRLQLAVLSQAYLAVVSARETLRYAQAGVEGIDRVLNASKTLKDAGNRNSADVSRIQAQREQASIGIEEAQEALRKAKVDLGGLLSMGPLEAEAIEIRASIRDLAPPPPSGEELVAMALNCRADVASYRLGVTYASKGLQLQKANRFADAYLLYQPYTYQNNSPMHLKSPTSYALGITVPLPIYNRNQGNIKRSEINIDQTKIQLEAIERKVRVEVRQAEQEYEITKRHLLRMDRSVLPASRKAMSDTEVLYQSGELDVTSFLTVQKEYNDVVRVYRDVAVRHRKSMLALNTVVGSRILP